MALTAKPLGTAITPIPGFLRIDLTVHNDNRGRSKEDWQHEKMVALGLPGFQPVQNNISFNDKVGMTQDVHAEPWDKFVSVATGRVSGVWTDLREGPSFDTVHTAIVDPSVTVFVPKGVGNSYQTPEPNTVYTCLVNDHWLPGVHYAFLNLTDETAVVGWPIPLKHAILFDKDKAHSHMADVILPLAPIPLGRHVLVIGVNGQLGRKLMRALPGAGSTVADVDLPEMSVSDAERVAALSWDDIDMVVNAAAWTNVDGVETPESRRATQQANSMGLAILARETTVHGATVVHISTEYAFDGTQDVYIEGEAPSPSGAYDQSKAGDDAAVISTPKHYIVCTSWVVGDGKGSPKTMVSLADQGIPPSIVFDQVGCSTFTSDLTKGIVHLLTSDTPFGIYSLSDEGSVMSWAQITKCVFKLHGRNPEDVAEVTTEEYFTGREIALRPLSFVFDLTKVKAADFTPEDSPQYIDSYVVSLRG